jgi:hypothetical protein
MINPRAIRYRKLALAEEDRANADLLLKLAEESDRGLLCTADWLSARPYRSIEPKPEEEARAAPLERGPAFPRR